MGSQDNAPIFKSKDEDGEDAEYASPFFGLEKGAVLQEARVFNDPQLDARRCQQAEATKTDVKNYFSALLEVITKLLYLLNQGDALTKTEATEVFFAVTKLFQSKDPSLRRMVYLIIKEISPSSDEVIIVTSSLMKDMNSKQDLYRANAIRVLFKIIDSGLLTQIERYLKQAVVDKNSVVASSALVSGIHLLNVNADVVRRWSNEVQEAVNSKHPLVQFHALALIHQIRQSDRLAISKLVSSLTRGTVRSPLAQCLLIRFTARVISESSSRDGERPFYDFLESCLRHKSEMVTFEAARAITEMNEVTLRELTPAITVLQLFLSSSKPVLRFAAVRMLNKVAMTHPMAVTNCNIDMEGLISDPNRSIATLAITTLLKTGNEGSVERLMKQIQNFLNEIQDENKIVVVEAVRSLCLKYPQKHRTLMAFLSNILREEGGFEYKKAIVDAILILIREIPEAKEPGLSHLCEFIEDCEFTYLSSQVLHLLGDEGPATNEPAKYIRYIYNRVILENATVRASAVSALAKFGARCPGLRPRIITLLRRCLFDNDDEVRDRAVFALAVLGAQEAEADAAEAAALPPSLLVSGAGFKTALPGLEAALKAYLQGDASRPFDASGLPLEGDTPVVTHGPGAAKAASAAAAAAAKDKAAKSGGGGGGGGGGDSHRQGPNENAELLLAVPQFAQLGKLFKSSAPVQLTEDETEYKVSVVKHVFQEHIVFQFHCQNTISEQVLESVTVQMDGDTDTLEIESLIPLPAMPLNKAGQSYVIMRRVGGACGTGKFANTLKFVVKEVDPTTGEPEEEGYEDEYSLETVDVAPLDYIQKVNVGNFRKAWDALDAESERADDYGLGQREGLQEAVEAVMGILGMQPCEGTEAVPPNARSHTMLMSGTFVGGVQVLVRMAFGIDSSNSVAMKLAVRAESADVSDIIHQIIAEA